MTKNRKNPHIGSSFDEFLNKDGVLKECAHQALKEILADQVRHAMAEKKISKSTMAQAMNTSRRQLDRLLDPNLKNVTLATMAKAARAVGRELRIELV